MSLKDYFTRLRDRVDASDVISNAGKDDSGFYKPKRTILLRHLNLLIDLHQKPLAKKMVEESWQAVQDEIPLEWLVMTDAEKQEFKKLLS